MTLSYIYIYQLLRGQKAGFDGLSRLGKLRLIAALIKLPWLKDSIEEWQDERFISEKMNPLPPPVHGAASSYYIEIISQCNLNCSLCAFGNRRIFERQHGKMDRELFTAILDKIRRENPYASVFPYHHCEPFLHPELPELVAEVKKRDFYCSISSNFNLVPRLEEVLASGLDNLGISVSGFSQKIYEKAHRGGNIETVKKNLHLLAELILKNGSSVKVDVYYHKYTYNLGPELDAMHKFAEDLGFNFSPAWARSINLEQTLMYMNCLQGIDQDIFGKAARQGVDFLKTMESVIYRPEDYAFNDITSLRANCVTNNRIINIKWNGRVNLCSWAMDERLALGNYLEFDPADLKKIRKKHPVCRQCLTSGFDLYSCYYDMPRIDEAANERLEKAVKC